MHGHCRLVTTADHEALTALLRAAYAGARDFCAVRTPRVDELGATGELGVAAFDRDGRMVSGVRAVAVYSADQFEPRTDLWTRMPPLLPTVLIKQAATAPTHAGRGLNGLLRYHLLRAATTAGFASSCGLMTSRGSRARALSEIGYAAFGQTDQVDGLVSHAGPWRLFVLDLSLPSALTRLRGMTAEAERTYPWFGEGLGWVRAPQTRPETTRPLR